MEKLFLTAQATITNNIRWTSTINLSKKPPGANPMKDFLVFYIHILRNLTIR